MTTRQILSSPLDFLCERCLEKLEWRLNYRKYKPLTTPSRCNICQEKTIYKAYRTICEECATKDGIKLCTKCGEKVENYGQPPADDGIQPSHAKNFILEEVPNGLNDIHKLAPIISSN